MTLEDLNEKMKIAVARPDLTADGVDDYSAYLNAAQKEICRMHSFVWMKESEEVTILAGTSSIALPADFKELHPSKTPVHLVDAASVPTSYIPIDMVTREKLLRLQRSYVSQASPLLFLDWSSRPPHLSMGSLSADENLVFDVLYYAFLDDLSEDEDDNALTTDHPQMLLAKAKALAFADINDALSVDMENLFDMKFKTARQTDIRAQLSGTALHM
jgi:hypothetical protein